MSSTIINPNGSPIDNLQTILDLGGMVPVFGEPIDGVNAIIYFARGDKVNAALSSGSMIPFIGNGVTGAKIVKKGLNASGNFIDVVNGTVKASSKELRENLIKAGVNAPDYANATHHIVAGTSQKANEARAILQKFGIRINDAANGVFLPTVKDVAESAYHPSLHTNAYYDAVNDMLKRAQSKEDVLDILDDIADQLSNGTFMK